MKHGKITAIILALCMLVTLMAVAPTAATATTTPAVVNGDFESGNYTGWAPSTGLTPSIKTDNDGNSYLEIGTVTNNSNVTQEVGGLTLGTTYMVAFDVCTNGAHFYAQVRDSEKSRGKFNNYNTNGNWERHCMVWTQGAGQADESKKTTSVKIMFKMLGTAAEGSYVWIDNVAFVESDNNLIENGSFEYGRQGLGERYGKVDGVDYTEAGTTIQSAGGMWITKDKAAVAYEKATDCVDGAYSLKITDAKDSAEYISQNTAVTVVSGQLYEAVFYVKNLSLAGTGDYAVNYKSNANDAVIKAFTAAELPVNKWVCLRVPYFPTTTTEKPQLNFGDEGAMLVDNFSLRKVDKACTYTGADDSYSANLVDGGKATITMLAEVNDMVALAIYSGDPNGVKTLESLKMEKITAEHQIESASGYAQITLTADSLEDFASKNYYAKILTIKQGTLAPIGDECIELTKAAQTE